MKIVRRILLALVAVAAVAVGVIFMGKTTRLENDYAARLSEAETELKDAEYDRDALDPGTETGAAAWENWKSGALQEGEEKLQEIRDENAALDASIQESEAKLEEIMADEDIAYYMTIYDSMAEGMEKVEEAIGQSN